MPSSTSLSNSSESDFLDFSNKGSNRYPNPFYNIPSQFLQRNMHSYLWWADHFLLKFGFYRTALSRIANYFITELQIESEDSEAQTRYKEEFDTMHWKEVLALVGLNLLGYGNSCTTINQGFNRFLNCPVCHKKQRIDQLDSYTFDKGVFGMTCPKCKSKGQHSILDIPSTATDRINIVHWNPRQIIPRHEITTNTTEYFWDIPKAYKQKVSQKDNKFYSKHVPKAVYDAVFAEKPLAFNKANFLHLKIPTPSGLTTDGRAIPLCIYMFDDFFMLKVLQRYNEAICFEDISPFRVIAMAGPEAGPVNPMINQNSGLWKSAVQEMIREHRKDPAAYHTFPFPINYQQLGGEGKTLAPVEMMSAAMNNILNALNIPQEMYAMTLQTQAVSPALRLFENSWSFLGGSYDTFLQHMADVIAKIKGLAPAKVSLMKVTFADDIERKSIVGQLVSANAIARSELLKLFNFDYKEQIRKKIKEQVDEQELTEEEQKKQQVKQMMSSNIFSQGGNQQQGGGQAGGGGGGGTTANDVLAEAQQKAQELFPLDGAQRRAELQKIKGVNATLYAATKTALDEMTASARSQGGQQAKQQGQGQGQGQGQPQQ